MENTVSMPGKKLRSHCPVNFALETFGDKWSLLVLRDIVFRGKRTYGEFLKSEERFATNILAARLTHLEDEGVLRKEVDADDARKSHYFLTEKGIDLLPLLFEMMLWSAKYDSKSEAKRAPRILSMLKKNGRTFTEEAKAHIRKGEPLFPKYLG